MEDPGSAILTRAPLRVYLLGRFEIVRAGSPIPSSAWRRRRPADLLKLIMLAPGHSMSRDALIDVLWPDKDPGSGANNLHRALYDLRQILGGRYVDIERGQLRVEPDVWVDVDAFEAAVQRGGIEAFTTAVGLYRGDLCPEDWDSPWLAPRRSLLRARFAEAAHPLASAAAERGDTSAVSLLRRILSVDPASEDTHRLLIKSLAESGRRAEALRQYDACEVSLRAAGLGLPSEDLHSLRAAIQRGELGPPTTRPGLDGARRAARRLLGNTDPGPVRGRGGVILLLESLLEAGHGLLVLLGESGVGKTRLAVEGARLAQSNGAAVLCGVAGAWAQGAPYGMFADAFLAERRSRSDSPDPFGASSSLNAGTGVSSEELRKRVFEAVESNLRDIASGRPLYLLLDDIDQAGESSFDLLHYLARRAKDLHLVIVATCSEEAMRAGTPVQVALSQLDVARLARGVRIPRLPFASVRELLADLRGEPPPELLVEQVYRTTDGSPLLIEEVVRAQQEPLRAEVPPDPAAALRARVERLGPSAGALLAAAAVFGRHFDFDVIRSVSGLSAENALVALERCLAARLIDDDAAGYHLHHALVRKAIYDGLPEARRGELHAAIANALEASSSGPREGEAPAEALAYHRLHAGQPERALRHLVTAGHRAAGRAGLREALAFFAEALRLNDSEGPTRGDGHLQLEILEAMGRAQLALGELGGAARSFVDAASVEQGGFAPSPDEKAWAFRLAAIAEAAGGELRAAGSRIEDGLTATLAGSGDEAAALHLLRSRLLWHDGKPDEARAAAGAALERAEALAEGELVEEARDLAAMVATRVEDEPRIAPLEPARTPSGPPKSRGQDLDLEIDLDLLLWERDLLGDRTTFEVARDAAALIERARLRDLPSLVATGLYGEGTAALASGDLVLAEKDLIEALRLYRDSASSLGEALSLERLATIRTMTGQFDDGLTWVDEGVVAAERGVVRRHALTRLYTTLARNRLAAGAIYSAEDAFREASASAARHGNCLTCQAALRAMAVRVSLARGRPSDAEGEAAKLEEIARHRGGRALVAAARLARARVLVALGHEALSALGPAREGFLASGLRYDAAICARIEGSLAVKGEPVEGELALIGKLVLVEREI